MRRRLYRLYPLHQAVRVRRHSHGQQCGCHRLREVHQLRQVRREVPGQDYSVKKKDVPSGQCH